MATLNLGRIKPVFRDAWSNSTAYVVDDIVTDSNETFICILGHTNYATSNATYWKKLAAKGTDGTDLTSTITTQGDILFRDGSGLQRLAKGTAAQTLKMNSGATAPEWTTVAAASADVVKIATVDGTGSSGILDFQNCFSATYEKYLILANLFVDASSNQTYMQFGNSANNATFRTANYNWTGSMWYRSGSGSGGGGSGGWGQNQIAQNETHNDSATLGTNHQMWVMNPFDSATDTTFYYFWGCRDAYVRTSNIHGYNSSTESHSGFKYFLSSSANYRTQSKVTVYGYKED